MKLSQVKPLTEQKKVNHIHASDLRTNWFPDQMASELHDAHFPDSYHVKAMGSHGVDLELEYELSEKKINDDKGHHLITFIYEPTRQSDKKVQDAIKKFEKDEEKFDQLTDEFNLPQIEIFVELGKHVQKVYGRFK